jgi:hypothetical protein
LAKLLLQLVMLPESPKESVNLQPEMWIAALQAQQRLCCYMI